MLFTKLVNFCWCVCVGVMARKEHKLSVDKFHKISLLGSEEERRPLLLDQGPPPADTCLFAYIILYLQGVGHLLPWNFFITANEVSLELVYSSGCGASVLLLQEHNFLAVTHLVYVLLSRTHTFSTLRASLHVSQTWPILLAMDLKTPLRTIFQWPQCFLSLSWEASMSGFKASKSYPSSFCSSIPHSSLSSHSLLTGYTTSTGCSWPYWSCWCCL